MPLNSLLKEKGRSWKQLIGHKSLSNQQFVLQKAELEKGLCIGQKPQHSSAHALLIALSWQRNVNPKGKGSVSFIQCVSCTGV